MPEIDVSQPPFKRKRPFWSVVVVKVIGLFQGPVIAMMRWAAQSQGFGVEVPGASTQREYIPANDLINPMVLMAAQRDVDALMQTDPEQCQSSLNACMECLGSEPMKTNLLTFFGHLIASGIAPDEAVVRVMANVLLLGIMLERRLESANVNGPVEQFGPSIALVGTCDLCGLPFEDHIPPKAGGGEAPHVFQSANAVKPLNVPGQL